VTESLGAALPLEIARVTCDVMPHYAEIGAPGAIALEAMKRDVRAACEATAAQDAIAMLRAYQALKGWAL